MTFTIAAPAAAKSWQQAWGDYDSQQQWHDAGWWLQNRHDWATVHHPEWTEDYAETWGQIGDTDQLHVWHYGTGGFDRATKLTIHKLVKASPNNDNSRSVIRTRHVRHGRSQILRSIMKAIKSRRVLVLGGILIAALTAGCYGGGHGYYSDPYGYNGGYYNANPYGGSYYYSNPNSYNGSYGNSYSYNKGYDGKNSYNAGYQNGVRADAANDRRQDRATNQRIVETQHTVAIHDRASISTQPSRVVRDEHESAHKSDTN